MTKKNKNDRLDFFSLILLIFMICAIYLVDREWQWLIGLVFVSNFFSIQRKIKSLLISGHNSPNCEKEEEELFLNKEEDIFFDDAKKKTIENVIYNAKNSTMVDKNLPKTQFGNCLEKKTRLIKKNALDTKTMMLYHELLLPPKSLRKNLFHNATMELYCEENLYIENF